MPEGFHTWTQNAISKIHIFKQFSDFRHIRFTNISDENHDSSKFSLLLLFWQLNISLIVLGDSTFVCLFCSPFQCTYYNIALT